MGQLRAVIDLPVGVLAPRCARQTLEALLPHWGLDTVLPDAQLVISELVTNAVRHAPGTDSFELELVTTSNGLRLSLADGSSIRPAVEELTDPSRPTGRGMAIVQNLADRWGADDHQGGKRVWVELTVD